MEKGIRGGAEIRESRESSRGEKDVRKSIPGFFGGHLNRERESILPLLAFVFVSPGKEMLACLLFRAGSQG